MLYRGEKHHYTMPSDMGVYERSKVFSSTDELRKMLSLFLVSEIFLKTFSEESFVYSEIDENQRNAVESLFDELDLYKDNEEYRNAIFFSCYSRLLVYISQNVIDVVSRPNGFIYSAVEYINDNICSDISVNDICNYVHISKYHFCRSFKAATGFTVMQYILKTRIVFAKKYAYRRGGIDR